MRSFLLTHPRLNPYKFSFDQTFRLLTSSFRHLPHFLIIGTSKAGKHSVLSYLNQHPMLKAGTKHNVGVYYFDSTFEYESLSWYKSHFPSKLSKFKIIGEASGTYLNHPLAPQRMELLELKQSLFSNVSWLRPLNFAANGPATFFRKCVFSLHR